MSYVLNNQKTKIVSVPDTKHLGYYKSEIVNYCSHGARLKPFNKLIKMFDSSTIKRMIINKEITLIPCGKCLECLTIKKIGYTKRVKSQLKMSKYSYLITLTFNNDKLPTMFSSKTKNNILDINKDAMISPYSTLSKIHISNIVKNWKNKLNRHYNEKVKLHYFLCGEYGERTKRAHYHIMLMLDKPLPNLKRENVIGNHFKSSLIDSKQYSMYDIQPTNASNSCSSYVSKYLTKSIDSELVRYNTFMEKQLNYYKENDEANLSNYKLFKSEEQLRRLLVYWLIDDVECKTYLLDVYRRNYYTVPITKMREFVKCSRCLGISSDAKYNIDNNVLNAYYFKKLINTYNYLLNYINNFYYIDTTIYLWTLLFKMYFTILRYYLYLFDIYERHRVNNIYKYFNKHIKAEKRYSKNDIL